jgi:glycosyltransferase involved in cell wall biosynthesis
MRRSFPVNFAVLMHFNDAAMADGKKLCLNMIVKNETANLERCLSAVAAHIACWVIGDTGSTDGTQDFILKFFAERGIPGELHSFPFINFAQARNAALDCAQASTLDYDYLLLDDADMQLVVEDPDFRKKLEGPCYDLLQRSSISYWNARIVRRDAGPHYHGVTHEYLAVEGGGQRLDGVWYKDHASGANRVDKLDRDIRLLTEALTEEPENHRYWFYLAQTYRDAGRRTEATLAYAKRAAMGGWDEEAWYARLQEARCLRDLNDDNGFVRQALVAFSERPQRAEPLYDLARFHRDRGLHAAAALFAEQGLALRRPEKDALFIEDFVYQWGLQEEYSIAANYSRDPVRKDRGFAACNWLALNRDIPADTRSLARHNLRFYVEPAVKLLPSFASRPVGFAPPEGLHPMNPSVARSGDEIVMVQRTVNFVLEDGNYRTPNDGPVITCNFLLRLDQALEVESSIEILPPSDLPPPAFGLVLGFEDMRLFGWRGALWCIATLCELTPEGWRQQVLARIDESDDGQCQLVDWRVLEPEGPRRHEKNWMPLVEGEILCFVYLCDPTRIVDNAARTVAETVSLIAAEEFRGGTQAIAFAGGWLALVHEVGFGGADNEARLYHHRFVWFDEAHALCGVSRPFIFEKPGVEFAAGLAWHPDGQRLIISYGVGDGTAWLATVEAVEVRAVLDDVAWLPSGAPAAVRSVGAPWHGKQPFAPPCHAHPNDNSQAADTRCASANALPSSRKLRFHIFGSPDTASTQREAPQLGGSVMATRTYARKLRFHILGSPHTAANKEYATSTHMPKVFNICRLLKEHGHTVIHYGYDATDVMCDEHVAVTTEDDLVQAYGNQDWKTYMFRYDPGDHAYQTFYRNSISEIANRKAANDFLLCMTGFAHKPVADAHSDMIVVEPGIGYPSSFARFKVFESYALYHAHYGYDGVAWADKLDWYCAVIPLPFDPQEFEFSAEKDDYFLYLGRVIGAKGFNIVLQVVDHIKAKLIVAGQGNLSDFGYDKPPDNVEFLGYVDFETRKRLLARAKGLFLPSQYIEPLGKVQIDALFSGTPTITTDWGGFTENNLHGITGYRCRTFDHFVWAAQNIHRIDPYACRRWAEENFAIDRVGEMYEEYFQYVMDVYTGAGWYQRHPERTNLDWLVRRYPQHTG